MPQVATEWTTLGDAYAELGQQDEASRAWESSLAILEELDHVDANAVRERLHSGVPG